MDSPERVTAPALSLRLDLAWALVLTTTVCLAAALTWRLPAVFLVIAATLFALLAWCVLRHWPADQDFGAANRTTLARAALVILLVSSAPFLPGSGAEPAVGQLWIYAAIALLALVLDGVDGALARALGCQSSFGARFDMELDAALMLGLCLAVMALDRAGAWVLALGLMRYAFVTAGLFLRWLTAPLPDSFRRKTVCVWQLVTLMVALLPPVSPAFASITLATALVLLVWSFALDICWLYHRRSSHESRHND